MKKDIEILFSHFAVFFIVNFFILFLFFNIFELISSESIILNLSLVAILSNHFNSNALWQFGNISEQSYENVRNSDLSKILIARNFFVAIAGFAGILFAKFAYLNIFFEAESHSGNGWYYHFNMFVPHLLIFSVILSLCSIIYMLRLNIKFSTLRNRSLIVDMNRNNQEFVQLENYDFFNDNSSIKKDIIEKSNCKQRTKNKQKLSEGQILAKFA